MITKLLLLFLLYHCGICQDLSITPINSDGEVIALLGNDLRLTCASSSTPLSFQWTHNEVLIENAVNKILQLVGVNQSDAGTYTCSATFTDFTLSASVEVIVENGWSSESSIHVIGILPNEVISGNTHELALYITTQEKERVNFTVKTLTSTIAASSVKSGSPVNIPLADSSDVDSITDRRKGIVISTGSRKKISVVISSISGTISIATYQVFPPWGYMTDEYIYFAVSATSLNDLGTILIVAANNNTAITISPSGSSINIPADLVGNGEDATINPGESVNITLHYLQSLLLLSVDAASDLTGTKVTSNKPIAFYSGHRCANVPQSAFTCDSIGEQIPPTIAWGHEFFLSSLNDKQSLVRIIAAESSTSLNMSCTSGDYTIQLSEEGQYASQDIPTNGDQYCSIMASKPICVVQFGFSFFHNGENSGDPLMVLIPPVQQYVSQSSIPVILKTSISLYMNLLVVTKNFNASDIFMDGIPLDVLTWIPVSSQESSIQGYITNGIDFSTGSEHIISTNNNIENRLCGIVYGIGNDFSSLRGYGYLGGRNLYPYESEVIPLPTIPPTQPVPQGSDVCMNDCNSQGQRQATQYELMCCDPLNLGNFIKFQDEAHRIRYVACQSTIPDWCPDNNNLNNKPLEVF